ncbi:receptor for activated protein kinase C [Culex quinquefasciatus]|uniref:Small ribosomal subunit protein RACK1 n=1 Tax=Culex quinquefasciatus TaxID=7176 RepID=B0XBS2_CULQU|nr:receptor for activated protein kinase C [Culex quinquefasciatus]|eukprot:XP_001867094.1 receptor for activated protein kinase C [Culex quinquefasciatus]
MNYLMPGFCSDIQLAKGFGRRRDGADLADHAPDTFALSSVTRFTTIDTFLTATLCTSARRPFHPSRRAKSDYPLLLACGSRGVDAKFLRRALFFSRFRRLASSRGGGDRFPLSGCVTLIETNPKYPDMILSSSRDVTLIVWKLTRDDASYGIPQKRLYGHSHFSSDVVLSSDDNRQIVSGSRDKTIKLWNTLAECKLTIWAVATSTRCPCRPTVPCTYTSGGKDCKAFLWGLNDGKHLHTLEHQRDLILAGQIQSVRRLRLVDQDLESCLQDHGRGAEAVEGRPAAVPVAGFVHRRTDLDAGYINNIMSVWGTSRRQEKNKNGVADYS